MRQITPSVARPNRSQCKIAQRLLFVCLASMTVGFASAQEYESSIKPLIEDSCIHCHDADTDTRLNFESLDHDLSDSDHFRKWVAVFDRINAGEMPPQTEPAPDSELVARALANLRSALQEQSLEDQREFGRVRSRRLTRLEYEYTLRDLLHIDANLAKSLPEESDSGGFDTVGATQHVSPVHIRSYLTTAEQALDEAISLGRKPSSRRRMVDYLNSPYVNMWHDRPLRLGGSVTKKLEDAVVLFVDLDYIMRSDAAGIGIQHPGKYRLSAEAYAYQAETPVTLKVIVTNEQKGGSRLVGAFDIQPGQSRSVEFTTYLEPGDYFYPSVSDIDLANPGGVYARGAADYKGEGIAVKSMHIEGPLLDDWPPESTRSLFDGLEFERRALRDGLAYRAVLEKEPLDHVSEIVERLGPLVFRRPLHEEEASSFIRLAEPAFANGQGLETIIRAPLRSMLSSPQFLFFDGEPGQLDDFRLANRLSYFLWKSMPDAELFQVATDGQLSDPEVLRAQVDRMLNDEKSTRFISDFLGQWLELYDINATTPDASLYPEFDDILNQAVVRETELFFKELIEQDLSVRNLVDSDFTFLNRRLAEHYEIEGVEGQFLQRVAIPDTSPRGGILTHASVLKVTANGTVTSPVMRGNFVLTKLLGQPPNPPPPNVGSIEPDTRGTTTIREMLDAHRKVETCAACHQHIDPPGFALESFDPIGGYREYYRSSKGAINPLLRVPGDTTGNYRRGPKVDSSGTTAGGESFDGIHDFKRLLLDEQEQIAKHLISQFVVYGTGAEIQFADREVIDSIAHRLRERDYPVREMIHEIVQSRLFRNK